MSLVLGIVESESTGEKYTVKLSVEAEQYIIYISDRNQFTTTTESPLGDIRDLCDTLNAVVSTYSY